MKYKNILQFILILANILLLFFATAIASDQQPVADSQITFHVA